MQENYSIAGLNWSEVSFLSNALAAFRNGGHEMEPALSQFEPITTAGQLANVATQEVVELDAFGVPWSSVHHSSNKSKTQKGKWRARPGGDEDAREAYESQYRTANPPTVVDHGMPPLTELQLPDLGPAEIVPQPCDKPTWIAAFKAVYGTPKYTQNEQNEMLAIAGVTNINEITASDHLRALTYGFLLGLQ